MKKRLILIALIAAFMIGCKNDVQKIDENKNTVTELSHRNLMST